MYIHAERERETRELSKFWLLEGLIQGLTCGYLARGFSVFAPAESQSAEASPMTDWMSAAAPYWGWYVSRKWLPFVSQFDLGLFNDHVRPSRRLVVHFRYR